MSLKGFPANCCCCTSRLLLLYFDDNGIDANRFKWCIADLSGDDTKRHVWLEIDSVVIDITADQFAGRYPVKFKPVVVSRASAWHASLKRVNREEVKGPMSEFCKRLRKSDFYKEAFGILSPILGQLSA